MKEETIKRITYNTRQGRSIMMEVDMRKVIV